MEYLLIILLHTNERYQHGHQLEVFRFATNEICHKAADDMLYRDSWPKWSRGRTKNEGDKYRCVPVAPLPKD